MISDGSRNESAGRGRHGEPRAGVMSHLSMSQRLRAKFVIMSGGALVLVLAVIIGIAELSMYGEMIATADHTLRLMADNEGQFPSDPVTFGMYDEQIGKETPYESRWFSVRLPHGGEPVVDTAQVVTIDEAMARIYSEEAIASGDEYGFVSSFRFIHRYSSDEDLLIFLDRGRQLGAFYGGLASIVFISAVGVAAVLVLLAIASKAVVRPFVESHVKQRQFITNAGHDIKTPLTIISADADVLAMDVGEDNEWLSDIKRQVGILTRLTNDLVFLSQMEEEQRNMTRVEFSLSDMVSDQVLAFASMARAEGRGLASDIQPGIMLDGDERMMRQLMSVLLDNAIKYSTDGGEVGVSLSRRKVTSLEVSNTAPVDSIRHIDRWFDRFYQEDYSRSASGDRRGFGIGLSVAQAVVTAHGGRIQAQVRDDNILVMVVTLP